MTLRDAGTALLLVSVLVIGGACDGPAETGTAQYPSSPSPPAPTQSRGGCPNQPQALVEGEVIGGGSTGDVDGDGSADLVRLARDDGGPLGCRIFLVAETSDGTLATPTTEPGTEYSLPEPRVHSFAQIDGSGGDEVLVDLEQGASSRFIGIFTVAEGRLQRVRVLDETGFGDLLPYGGSAGHIEASNCVDHPSADIVMAIATPNATDYAIRSRLYDMEGAELVPLPRRDQPQIERSADFSAIGGFATSPFGDCPGSG